MSLMMSRNQIASSARFRVLNQHLGSTNRISIRIHNIAGDRPSYRLSMRWRNAAKIEKDNVA